ncbi:MAG: hypothetical protein J0I06_20520, partial [Planctomycetes bacterium]|nr:hypothetical protein [Planctomycetota bacterium]
ADLVIETDTNLIRSLVLERQLPAGPAKLMLTHVGNAVKDPSAYTAEGHIRAGAPVHYATHLRARRAMLFEQLKEIANGQ